MFRLLKKYKTSVFAAIAEIVIVFIGISISLYIDDWKEDKKNKEDEIIYLKELYSELTEDFRELQSLKNKIEKKGSLLNLILGCMHYPDSMSVDQMVFKRAIGQILRLENFVSKDYTFKDLTSTGNMKLISDQKLRKLIYQYYNYVEQAEKTVGINGKVMTDLLNNHIVSTFPLRELMDYNWMIEKESLTNLNMDFLRMPDSEKYVCIENVLLLRTALDNIEVNLYKGGFQTCHELRSLLGERLGIPNDKAFVEDFMESDRTAVELYHEYLEKYPDFLLIEMAVNSLAYETLRKNTKKALELFQLNKEMYPDSPNVYDSLGDGHLEMGNRDSALAYFRKAYNMNPGLLETKNKLIELERLINNN